MSENPVAVTQALLPCPFCGGDEISHGWSAPGVDGSASTGEVQCHSCDLLLWKETEAEAIAAWNTRAQSPATGLEREADGAPGGEDCPFIAGNSWKEPEDDCWTSEVQIVGGHYVVATVHGATQAEAEARRDAVLAALTKPTPPASVSGKVVTVPKADRLVSGLQAVYGHTQAIAEYRKRVGDWSANDHDHLLISALDSIARICSHHLAGEPLAAAPEAATPSAVGGVGDVQRLRAALISCGRHVGAILADEVSTDFLMHVPEEVRLKIAAVGGVDRMREALEFYRDAWTQDADAERTATGWEGSIGDLEPSNELLADKGERARAALASGETSPERGEG